MSDYMKKPCKHCPFRSDVKPFLHPERAADIAFSAQNRFADFPCHKTTEDSEDEDGYGVRVYGENTKTCAGWLTLRANELGEKYLPKGFEPSWELCYTEAYEMADAYEEEWNKLRTAP